VTGESEELSCSQKKFLASQPGIAVNERGLGDKRVNEDIISKEKGGL